MRKPTFDSVEDYLAEREIYNLGILPTEMQNPKTEGLSRWVKHDPMRAIAAVKDVDANALRELARCGDEFAELSREIADTLEKGNKIFLCGCGATGRLSLALEAIWRADEKGRRGISPESVVGFMAGGDIALVRSVENFEDMPSFGAKHLIDLGFQAGDLLISPTEGGETPFVIGATEKAAEIAEQENGKKPYFLYCNPNKILLQVERSRKVIESRWIRTISIPTGPMALSGSTRLQASTVLMYGIGLALFFPNIKGSEFSSKVDSYRKFFEETSLEFLGDFSQFESDAVKTGNFLLYETDNYGITILTDTTERSPTFSLRPFENIQDGKETKPCLSYLCIPNELSSETAWKAVLGRLPRGLDWPDYAGRLSQAIALGFDFSVKGGLLRKERVAPASLEKIFIGTEDNGIRFVYGKRDVLISTNRNGEALSLLERHLLLKLILNTHSLLVMGKLGRYESNVMTWVRPSNGKLIDRSVRYIRYLLAAEGVNQSYETVAKKLFEVYKRLGDDEPVVVSVVKSFLGEPKERPRS